MTVQLPFTPAGKMTAAFLDALNCGDIDMIMRLVENRERAANLTFFSGPQWALTAYRIEQADDHEITLVAHIEASDSWRRLNIRVNPEKPDLIADVIMQPTKDPTLAGSMSAADIAAALGEYLDKLAAADLFSGVVMLEKDGVTIFKRAYGLASKSFNIPNRLDTKFNLGSMNKMFTGVATAQLAQQGKLSFDDPISKHLPDYPNQEIARKVTLHHLLTHTSGLGSYWNEKFEQLKPRLRAVNDFIPLFADDPLAFEPGEQWSYSNAGFIVLGAVIEAVTGQSYFDYVRENIYQPAEMTDTDAYEMDVPVPNLAIGYTKMNPAGPPSPTWKNNLFMHVVKGGPAGGGFSTAPDLLNFAHALLEKRLLSADYTRTVMTGKVDTPRLLNSKYAYGFQVLQFNGTRVVGHGGGFPGISSLLDIYVDSGYIAVILSNYDMGAVMVGDKLREWLTTPTLESGS